MPLYFLYIIYTGALWAALLAIVPRDKMRTYLVYGILFGGLADAVILAIVDLLLGIGGFINFGPLGFGKLPFFPPLAWSAFFAMYFYFLPSRWYLRYPYMLTTIIGSVAFSNMLMNLGIFQWKTGRLLTPLLVYTFWTIAVTWGYRRISQANEGHRDYESFE
jgi:hypothetical protein